MAPPSTVAGGTAVYSTPQLSQYVYNMPPDDGGDNETLSAMDYVMIAVLFLMVLGGAGFFLHKFFGKVCAHGL